MLARQDLIVLFAVLIVEKVELEGYDIKKVEQIFTEKAQGFHKQQKVKDNNIIITHPELVAEWDYEKNNPITPDMITHGSNRKFYWICKKCSYSWKASPCNRTNKAHPSGCPACAGRVCIPGINDLATKRPDLLCEWDYKKNDQVKPEDVTVSSSMKVSWVCRFCDHTWDAKIYNRTYLNTGCPACTNYVCVTGKNDLASVRPDLICEWDYEINAPLTPDIIVFSSKKKVAWDCRICGYSWYATIYDRTNAGTDCPVCAGKIVVPGVNDLGTIRPDLLIEWDYEKNNSIMPEELTVHSGRKVAWICNKCGHTWNAKVCNRTKAFSPSGCPACARNICIVGKNDLATTHPNLVLEWDYERNYPVKPEDVAENSSTKFAWICNTCGHSWIATPNHRTGSSSDCPACAGLICISGKNDLASMRPDLIDEWDYQRNNPLKPESVAMHSGKNVAWICRDCGYSWEASPNHRTNEKKPTGCPSCAGKICVTGKNDIATMYPELLTEWDYERNGSLKPETVSFGSKHKVAWCCNKCSYSWIATPNSRTKPFNPTGCPACAGKICVTGKNDLATMRPDLLREWDYAKNALITPENIAVFSSKKINWLCTKCGHSWNARVSSRTAKKSGCPHCAGKCRSNTKKS